MRSKSPPVYKTGGQSCGWLLAIQRQLGQANGLIGYLLLARPVH
jgi:hypothetical protein